ncbi:ExbD/TolR family protein [Alteripontixanthobacter maritimus]|nr:biopolymer transporter ExbD [Alteripontixanthobacter maritimus]
MSELNTTPLIDVMLVLLIMFIVTIPVATHETAVDLPQCGARCDDVAFDDIKNKLVITQQDELLWNGEAISETQLLRVLHATRNAAIEPELQYEPDAQASYSTAASTLNLIRQSGVTKFGFVGNDRYRQFARAD